MSKIQNNSKSSKHWQCYQFVRTMSWAHWSICSYSDGSWWWMYMNRYCRRLPHSQRQNIGCQSAAKVTQGYKWAKSNILFKSTSEQINKCSKLQVSQQTLQTNTQLWGFTLAGNCNTTSPTPPLVKSGWKIRRDKNERNGYLWISPWNVKCLPVN